MMADTAAYSDVIFGLFHLLGYQFSPRLADIGAARLWRIDPTADYGVLDPLSKNRVQTERIERSRSSQALTIDALLAKANAGAGNLPLPPTPRSTGSHSVL